METTGCLDEDTLLRLGEGALPPDRVAAVDAHLDGCGDCRRLLAALARSADEPSPRASGTSAQGEAARIGRYLLLHALGRGAMGVVYLAYDPQLDRKVALKLIRSDAPHEEPRALQSRLLREARSLAQLSHPNVVAVFDVGAQGDSLYLAMDYVEGGTVRDWLAERPRTQREIVRLFTEAGRGLAAAHAAGIVHRDFKPDNVLVGTDGRPRVCDFGLSRPAEAQREPEQPAGLPGLAEVGPLTRTGAAVGSPAYMAPEVLGGAAASVRSDLFGFCVSLHEALAGERPFAGRTVADLQAQIRAGPRLSRTIPARLRRALARGLHPDPAQRWPSMEPLLELLSRGSRRPLLVAAAGVAVVMLSALFAAQWQHRRTLCRSGEGRMREVWSPEARAQLASAFEATGLAYQGSAFQAAARLLDAQASAWTAMHREACEATHLRGEQSEALLDLRMQCLSQRLEEQRALVVLLRHADAALVQRAPEAAAALSPLAPCADAARLRMPLPPPSGAQERARLDILRRELAEVKALHDAGEFKQALPKAEALVSAAKGLGYRPLWAEASFWLGKLQHILSRNQEAAGTLREAALMAEAARRDDLAAEAWTRLSLAVGDDLGKPDEGLRWSDHAEAEIQRLGGDDELESMRLLEVGRLLTFSGKADEALAVVRRALTLREQHLPADDPRLQVPVMHLALALSATKHYDEALLAFRRSQHLASLQVGDDHPLIGQLLSNMIETLVRSGRKLEAEQAARRALAIRERAFGERSPEVATTVGNLGLVLADEGKFDESLPLLRRAVAIRAEALGAESPAVTVALSNLGEILLQASRPAEAIGPLSRALEMLVKRPAPPKAVAMGRFRLAKALAAAGSDRGRALALARQAREALTADPHQAEVAAWLDQQARSAGSRAR